MHYDFLIYAFKTIYNDFLLENFFCYKFIVQYYYPQDV